MGNKRERLGIPKGLLQSERERIQQAREKMFQNAAAGLAMRFDLPPDAQAEIHRFLINPADKTPHRFLSIERQYEIWRLVVAAEESVMELNIEPNLRINVVLGTLALAGIPDK